jgi:hypothetical protein
MADRLAGEAIVSGETKTIGALALTSRYLRKHRHSDVRVRRAAALLLLDR